MKRVKRSTACRRTIITAVLLLVGLGHRAALAQQDPRAAPQAPQAPQAHGAAPTEEDHTAEAADVSKQLANPIANMVSLPFQFNWFGHIAPFDSTAFVLNVQPVIPITLNDDWNLILRFILPFVGAPALTTNGIPQSGTSDITASVFFSPAHSKLIWGVGPVFTAPTSTNPALTSGQWGIGPTGVVLKEIGKWTVGVLANQVWSYAAMANYFNGSVSQMFLQPFATLQMEHAVSLTFTSEETYNWEASSGQRSTVPIQIELGKVTRLGPFPFQVEGGGGYFIERPDDGPHWQVRLNFILILPREHKK